MKWSNEAKKAFHDIKEVIIKAPVLTSPDYKKPFNLYSFASNHSVVGVLTQKYEEDKEKPIAFMSAPLKDVALNYSLLDKQAYALVRAVKKFRHYIFKSQIIAIVPDPAIKNLLSQQELGVQRGNWVSTLQEFDLTIQPMKIIRGQGLSQTLASCGDDFALEPFNGEDGQPLQICQTRVSNSSWYVNIVQYLTSRS